MGSIYLCWEMVIESPCLVISIPTIFVSSPRSVHSHSDFISVFILFINSLDVAKSIKSLTQTVIISRSASSLREYTQGSEVSLIKPCFFSLLSSSRFHSRPDCFRLYSVLTSKHDFCVP